MMQVFNALFGLAIVAGTFSRTESTFIHSNGGVMKPGVTSTAAERLQNAMKGNGLLTHSIFTQTYAEFAADAEKKGGVYAETDCGPMCTAFSLLHKDIPASIFAGGSVGYFLPVDSELTTQYAKSMVPHDAGTAGRQWCAQGSTSGVEFDDLYESAKNYNGAVTLTPDGCEPGDTSCEMMAAGSGYQPMATFSQSALSALRSEASTSIAPDFFGQQWLEMSLVQLTRLSFDEPNCSRASEASTEPGVFPVAADCERCSALDICPSDMSAGLFNKRYIEPVFALLSTFPGAWSLDGFMGTLGLDSTCKLNSTIPQHWQVLRETYNFYWEQTQQFMEKHGIEKTEFMMWNEVNLYVPKEGTAGRENFDQLFRDNVVGLVITGNTTEAEEALPFVQRVAAAHQLSTGESLGIYHCTNHVPAAGKACTQIQKV